MMWPRSAFSCFAFRGFGRAAFALALALSLVLTAGEVDAAARKVPMRAADRGDHARIVFDWPVADVKYTLSITDNRLIVSFGEAVEAATAPVLERLSAWFASAGPAQDGRAVAFVLKHPGKIIHDGRSGNAVYIDIAEDMTKPAPVPAPITTPTPVAAPVATPTATPKVAPAAPPAAAAPVAPVASPVIVPASPASPAAAAAAATAVMSFDPGQPAAAAVYQRTGYLYVVFDRPLPIGAGTLTGNTGGLIGAIEPMPVEGGSAFRVSMRPWLRPLIERSGAVWRVIFVPRDQPARTELVVESQPEFPLGGRVLVRATDASSVIEVTDPEVGDTLLVVPLPVAMQAVSEIHRFAQVDLLPALQGVALRAKGNGVAARLVREGIEITAAGGLRLSPVADAALGHPAPPVGTTDAVLSAFREPAGGKSDAPGGRQASDGRLFDLVGWQLPGGAKQFTKNRQELMQAVADALPAEKNRARLALARFYFAHGFNQEAVGLMAVLSATQPDFQGWPEFRALRAAARIASGEPREGMEDLTGPGLEDNREAMMWRGAALAMLNEKSDQAAKDFAAADDILANYPEPHFKKLSLLDIDVRIDTNNPRDADRLLKRLIRRAGPNSEERPPMEFYRGEILREQGKVDEAIKHLQAAEEGGDRYFRARAGLARVTMEAAAKRISPPTAADRLSRLRFAWRGDELELEIIQAHGAMQWAAGNYADGLNTLREAAGYFPESSHATAITQDMTRMFGDLFADGAAKLPPLKAIELYDQFRELTPVGTAGDEVIRQLAERLVEVDLLDRAAELLQHQVQYRLLDAEKARVGTRLATIRLLDRKPALALKALDSSQYASLPPEQVEERRLLKARSLAELQRSNEALKLLDGDTSRPADMLRVDIAWHDQRWDDAAAALDKVIGPPPEPGTVLDASTGQLVLNRAIALALAGDDARLELLRVGFGPLMAATAVADAFAVLTRPEQAGGLIDLASIKSRVAEVDVFQNFLKGMRQKPSPPSTPPSPPSPPSTPASPPS
ncbi:MAG: tetratricopeptide repeat protein [Rhodospirillaceae bacterium]